MHPHFVFAADDDHAKSGIGKMANVLARLGDSGEHFPLTDDDKFPRLRVATALRSPPRVDHRTNVFFRDRLIAISTNCAFGTYCFSYVHRRNPFAQSVIQCSCATSYPVYSLIFVLLFPRSIRFRDRPRLRAMARRGTLPPSGHGWYAASRCPPTQ